MSFSFNVEYSGLMAAQRNKYSYTRRGNWKYYYFEQLKELTGLDVDFAKTNHKLKFNGVLFSTITNIMISFENSKIYFHLLSNEMEIATVEMKDRLDFDTYFCLEQEVDKNIFHIREKKKV